MISMDGADSPRSLGSSPGVSSTKATPGSSMMNGLPDGFDGDAKIKYPSKAPVRVSSCMFSTTLTYQQTSSPKSARVVAVANDPINVRLPQSPSSPSIKSAPPAIKTAAGPPAGSTLLADAAGKRPRSSSNASEASEGRSARSGSVTTRIATMIRDGKETAKDVKEQIKENLKPDSASSISPTDSLHPAARSTRKSRTRSTSSGKSGEGIAALARGGIQLANAPHGEELISPAVTSPRDPSAKGEPKGRSPFLVSSGDASVLEDGSEMDDDDYGSDVGDELSVSGFAVASARRNTDFHAQFPNVDEGDLLIEGE